MKDSLRSLRVELKRKEKIQGQERERDGRASSRKTRRETDAPPPTVVRILERRGLYRIEGGGGGGAKKRTRVPTTWTSLFSFLSFPSSFFEPFQGKRKKRKELPCDPVRFSKGKRRAFSGW